MIRLTRATPQFFSNVKRSYVISISGKHEFLVPDAKAPKAGAPPLHRPLPFRRRRELDSLPARRHDSPKAGFSASSANEGGIKSEEAAYSSKPESPKVQIAKFLESIQPTTSGLIIRLLKMRVVKNMTKNGKYARFSALVAVGNGKGAVGVAHGKALNAADALNKASQIAARSMEYFPSWQDRTIFHDDQVKWKATRLMIRPAAPQTGRRCHPAIAEICRCMGIKDISAKVHGSRHAMNVAEAFLLAMRRQKTPEAVAQESGMRIVDVLKTFHQGCVELTKTLRAERYSNLHLKTSPQ